MTCRWPEEYEHASRDAAQAAIKALERDGKGNPDIDVYPCGDHWHVGHSVVHFSKRIRRALTPGRAKNTVYARNRRRKR
jgi:hypothetical protein